MATFRMFEYLNNEVNRPFTRQLLNNFWGGFLENLKQFLGRGSKMNCFFFKKVEWLSWLHWFLIIKSTTTSNINYLNFSKLWKFDFMVPSKVFANLLIIFVRLLILIICVMSTIFISGDFFKFTVALPSVLMN